MADIDYDAHRREAFRYQYLSYLIWLASLEADHE